MVVAALYTVWAVAASGWLVTTSAHRAVSNEHARATGCACGITRRHLGCFVDAANDRCMPTRIGGYPTFTPNNTADVCRGLCDEHGFGGGLIGLSSGNMCWCSPNKTVSSSCGKPTDGCTVSCAGDQTQRCGGHWRIELIDFMCTECPTGGSLGTTALLIFGLACVQHFQFLIASSLSSCISVSFAPLLSAKFLCSYRPIVHLPLQCRPTLLLDSRPSVAVEDKLRRFLLLSFECASQEGCCHGWVSRMDNGHRVLKLAFSPPKPPTPCVFCPLCVGYLYALFPTQACRFVPLGAYSDFSCMGVLSLLSSAVAGSIVLPYILVGALVVRRRSAAHGTHASLCTSIKGKHKTRNSIIFLPQFASVVIRIKLQTLLFA
jgi:hypothetical protein